ncbi:MAG: hypothetical protein HYR73_07975 [Candidatus Eisenbacteria bacterium]|nr:hypothetical protein [Candidatus Eisenbacteria bacterium]
MGPRRADGYHEIATFFQSVSLADTLNAAPARRGFSLRIVYEDAALRRAVGQIPGPAGLRRKVARARGPATRWGGRSIGPALERVPAGAGNLVLRAARLVARSTGLERGTRFTLIKRIPTRSGLGGGSADAAAAIVALDRLFALRLGGARRMALAVRLGSDVPFALRGGTALGLGRGERLIPVRLAAPFRALIAVPRWRVSTARAFNQIDLKNLGLTGWASNLRFVQKLTARRLKPDRALGLGNTMERALGARRSDFLSLRARLRAVGIRNPLMTGSGSAVFGLIESRTSFAEVARRFKGDEPLFAVRSLGLGQRVVSR